MYNLATHAELHRSLGEEILNSVSHKKWTSAAILRNRHSAGHFRSAVERDNVMSSATMTDDVETFDFTREIRAFQARVEIRLASANSNFDVVYSTI